MMAAASDWSTVSADEMTRPVGIIKTNPVKSFSPLQDSVDPDGELATTTMASQHTNTSLGSPSPTLVWLPGENSEWNR